VDNCDQFGRLQRGHQAHLVTPPAGKVIRFAVAIRPGSPMAEVHRELDGLDAMIAARQAKHMSHGVMRIRTLVTKIELMGSRYTRCAAIVSSSLGESSVSTSWDGDTHEMGPTDR
jgi:hypothetical protein